MKNLGYQAEEFVLYSLSKSFSQKGHVIQLQDSLRGNSKRDIV